MQLSNNSKDYPKSTPIHKSLYKKKGISLLSDSHLPNKNYSQPNLKYMSLIHTSRNRDSAPREIQLIVRKKTD